MPQRRTVEVAEGTRTAAFGERHGAGVEDGEPAVELLQLGDMGVSVGQHRADADRRQLPLVPQMPVREEERLGGRFQDRIVAHHRKFEHQLVDFGIAIAAYGEDLVLQSVQDTRHLLRVVEVGHAVARAVVEQVAEEDDAVVAQRFGGGEGLFQRGWHAVDVA